MTTPLTARQKQVQFQASRRSTREMEEILAGFLAQHLATLSDDQCDRLLRLLHHPDVDLYDWLTRIKPLPADVDAEMIHLIHGP